MLKLLNFYAHHLIKANRLIFTSLLIVSLSNHSVALPPNARYVLAGATSQCLGGLPNRLGLQGRVSTIRNHRTNQSKRPFWARSLSAYTNKPTLSNTKQQWINSSSNPTSVSLTSQTQYNPHRMYSSYTRGEAGVFSMPESSVLNFLHENDLNLQNYQHAVTYYGSNIVPGLPPHHNPYKQLLMPLLTAEKTIDIPIKMIGHKVLLPPNYKTGHSSCSLNYFAQILKKDAKYLYYTSLIQARDDTPIIRFLFTPTPRGRKWWPNIPPYQAANHLSVGLDAVVLSPNIGTSIGFLLNPNPLVPTDEEQDLDWQIFTPPNFPIDPLM